MMEENGFEKDLVFHLCARDTPLVLYLCSDTVVWSPTKVSESAETFSKKAYYKITKKSIPWKYVIASELGENCSNVHVHYIEKKPKNIWTKECIIFQGPEVNCKEFYQAVNQKLDQLRERPKNLLIFVNPVSGSAKNGTKIYHNIVAPLLNLANVNIHTVVTEYGGHIKEYIQKQDLLPFDGIVVVGGDGSFTEGINGLLLKEATQTSIDINNVDLVWPKPRMRIGIVPAGTGQGMVKAATGSKDVTTAVLHIIVGTSSSIPCLTVHNGGKFLALGSMLSGYGFFGDTIRDSEAKRSLGIARYAYGMAKAFIKHRELHLTVKYRPTHSNQTTTGNSTTDSTENLNKSNQAQKPLNSTHDVNAPEATGDSQCDYKTDNTDAAHGAGATSVENTPIDDVCESVVGADGDSDVNVVETAGARTSVGAGALTGAAASIEADMQAVDITSDTPTADDGWITQTGVFRALNIFLLNIAAAKGAKAGIYPDGGMSFTLVKGAAGRIKGVGAILKTFDILSSENSSKEVAEFLEVDRIEFSLTNETVESLEKLSQTEKREVINVDGDPFVLLHPDVHIKKQNDVIELFGEGGTEPFKW